MTWNYRGEFNKAQKEVFEALRTGGSFSPYFGITSRGLYPANGSARRVQSILHKHGFNNGGS